MGGYFLETCESVIGRGNIMLENGSRGVTIERGSLNCIFSDNIVRQSGREGLWAPDCIGLVVTNNIFEFNGRKPNGPEKRFIWNANITINEATRDPTNTPTRDYLISGNIITSSTSQPSQPSASIRPLPESKGLSSRGMFLLGENKTLHIEGPIPEAVQHKGQTGHTLERGE